MIKFRSQLLLKGIKPTGGASYSILKDFNITACCTFKAASLLAVPILPNIRNILYGCRALGLRYPTMGTGENDYLKLILQVTDPSVLGIELYENLVLFGVSTDFRWYLCKSCRSDAPKRPREHFTLRSLKMFLKRSKENQLSILKEAL